MNDITKILIIDDNPADSNLLIRQLRLVAFCSFDFKVCSSAQEAYIEIPIYDPHIIFADYLLGAVKGTDVIHNLKQSGISASLVLLTGFGSEEIVKEAFRYGANDYINKHQCTVQELERTLRFILDKRVADKKLYETQIMLERVLEKTEIGLLTLDTNGVVLDTNNSFLKLIQIADKNKVIGQHLKAFVSHDYQIELSNLINSFSNDFILDNIELSFVDANDRNIYFLLSASFDIRAGKKMVTLILRNISQRKKYEEDLLENQTNLKKAQEIAKLGNWTLIPSNNQLFWSDEIYKIMDIHEQSDPVDLFDLFLFYISPESRDIFLNSISKAIETGKLEPIEFSISTPREQKKVLKQEGEVVNIQGEPLKIIGIIQDITEQKSIIDKLTNATDKAEESSRLKTAFLSNLSHEVRTPMNAIVGFSELMPYAETDEQRKEYIQVIRQNGFDLMNLIDNIIEISRLESGELEVRREEFYLNKCIDYVANIFQDEMRKKDNPNIHYKVLKALSEDILVFSDKLKITKVFSHLLKNALKFTDNGVIEFGYNVLKNNNIRFFVRDTGIGIREENFEVIFESFRKVNENKNKLFGGSGLGLTISAKLLKLINGKIWLESTVGKGSTFYFEIYNSEPTTDSKKMILNENEVQYSDNLIVLLLNYTDYNQVKQQFSNLKIQVLWAEDAEEAWQLCTNYNKTSLIFVHLDTLAPTGYEYLRKIRSTYPKITILGMSSKRLNNENEAIIETFCNHWFISENNDVQKVFEFLKEQK